MGAGGLEGLSPSRPSARHTGHWQALVHSALLTDPLSVTVSPCLRRPAFPLTTCFILQVFSFPHNVFLNVELRNSLLLPLTSGRSLDKNYLLLVCFHLEDFVWLTEMGLEVGLFL